MFNKPKPYTTADLNDAVMRLERLSKLQEQTEQHLRLNASKMTQESYKATTERYTSLSRNITTASKYLEHLQSQELST